MYVDGKNTQSTNLYPSKCTEFDWLKSSQKIHNGGKYTDRNSLPLMGSLLHLPDLGPLEFERILKYEN